MYYLKLLKMFVHHKLNKCFNVLSNHINRQK